MGLFAKVFGQSDASSGNVAKQRLQIVLVQDRIKLPPPVMDALRGELVAVLSKYVDVDTSGVDISLSKHARQSRLVADIPIVGAKSEVH